LLDNLAIALENADQDTRSKFKLRRVLTGGAPVSDPQLEHWTRAFRSPAGQTEIIVAYGSTEAEPVGHIHAAERLSLSCLGKGFCTGRPTELVQTMVVPVEKGTLDLNDRTLEEIALPVGEIGELVVAGDHVCRDYYKNETATDENKLKDEHENIWHRMGDTGYFDDEGRFWLVGRVHSTIIRGGQHVHPQIVEQIAASVCPEVDQVAAVGYDDPELGELVIVVAFIKQLGNVKQVGKLFDHVDDIKTDIKKRLEKMNQPCDRVVVTDSELAVDPRHNSKIDYAKVKELLPEKLWPDAAS
jgi:acyl-CoA synthetase (AMP-forming)/AMP-acid ligase II